MVWRAGRGPTDWSAVGAGPQGDHARQRSRRHAGLVGARLLGPLSAHEVPDGSFPGADRGVPAEGDGLGKQAGVGHPVGALVNS